MPMIIGNGSGREGQHRQYNFVTIGELTPSPSANFYGRVTHFSSPESTRGTDYIMKLTVVDESRHSINVVIFRPNPNMMPQVRENGDIVQFRHIRIQDFNGHLQALSTKWSVFAVFTVGPGNTWVVCPQRAISPQEMSLLGKLASLECKNQQLLQYHPQERQLREVKDIKPNVFCDMVGEVLNVQAVSIQQTILWLCDYTSNDLISFDCERHQVSVEYRQKVLVATIWDEFAAVSRDLKIGQIVKIINLHPKLVNGGLVVSLHGDSARVTKLFPIRDQDPRALAICRRRTPGSAQKTKSFGEGDPSLLPKDCKTSNLLINDDYAHELEEGDVNKHTIAPTVQAGFTQHITLIHRLPKYKLQNIRYLVAGKVKSFEPLNILDFTRLFCPICNMSFNRLEQKCRLCDATLSHWFYAFSLEIVDSKGESVAIAVTGSSAISLLNGLQPCSLAIHPDVLLQIRHRLIELTNSEGLLFPIIGKTFRADRQELKYFLNLKPSETISR